MSDIRLEELRTAFGLAEEASVEIAAEIPVPEGDVGRGEAALALDASGVDSYEQLSSVLVETDELDELVQVDKPFQNACIYTSPYAGLLAVAPADVVTSVDGKWWTRKGMAFCDTRKTAARALVSEPDGFKGLEVRADLVTTVHLKRHASKELRALTAHEPRAVPGVSAPDVEALLGEPSTEPWLVAEAKEMAATDEPLLRLAAAGMVARLFSPRDPSQRQRMLSELIKSGKHPVVEAVREYARNLDAAAVEELDLLASALADGLFDRLDELRELVVEGSEDADDAALGLLLSRDEIESAVYVLRAAGGGENAVAALEAFDREAVASAADVDLAEPPFHERLLAVSRCDPKCWWGQE
ncbi:MAG: hypothetical protein R6V85_13170 [Polyangia bacterium]